MHRRTRQRRPVIGAVGTRGRARQPPYRAQLRRQLRGAVDWHVRRADARREKRFSVRAVVLRGRRERADGAAARPCVDLGAGLGGRCHRRRRRAARRCRRAGGRRRCAGGRRRRAGAWSAPACAD
eukprot:365378-Chlamydomonas_euryale.AAC.1